MISGNPLGIYYTSSKFIVVTASRTAAYSTTGTSWTSCTSAFTTAFGTSYTPNYFILAGSILVAVCSSVTAAAYSSNGGTSWTSCVTAISALLGSIYGAVGMNSKLVLCDNQGNSIVSTNGSTWTSIGKNPGYIINGGVYASSKYVTIHSEAVVCTSTDYTTWTKYTDLAKYCRTSGGEASSVCYGNKFVAVGEDAASSTDGFTWNSSNLPAVLTAVYGIATLVAYGSSIYVTTTELGYAATSSDGITWAFTSNLYTVVGGSKVYALCYGDKFVVVGSVCASTSTDGITWTTKTSSLIVPYAVCFGNSLYVAVGNGGKCSTSPDGVTWTIQSDFNSKFGSYSANGIAYGNGVFVAVGANAMCATSQDGVTWTAQSALAAAFGNYSVNCIYFTGTVFVALGHSSGKCVTSRDGITWTVQASKPAFIVYSAAYNGLLGIAVGYSSASRGVES